MFSDRQMLAAYQACRFTVVPAPTPAEIQPASLDVRLAPEILALDTDGSPLDPKVDTAPRFKEAVLPEEGLVLYSGQLWLGSTVEYFALGEDVVAQLEGKSSLGRLGLQVHSTAGFIDPGFSGQVTLELSCVHHLGVILYPNMKIGQVAFTGVEPVLRGYAGKYRGQTGPTASRYFQNWTGQGWK